MGRRGRRIDDTEERKSIKKYGATATAKQYELFSQVTRDTTQFRTFAEEL